MTDIPEPTPDAPVSPPQVRVVHTRWWQRLSIVWLIPLVALFAGGWLAVKAVRERGPTVTITLLSAEGLEPGKTKVKFKALDVGLVKSVALARDRSKVVVTAEMTRAVADMMVEDTRFWVVRPRVAGGGVSGLDTLLSGAYIGMDVGASGDKRSDFVGLEVPPVLTANLAGRLFRLKSPDLGSLSYGTPVYFRRIEVGELVAYELDADGGGVTARVFIHAPYDQFVTNDTRFWHASGIDLSVDAAGVRVNTQSLSSIVSGGIAFESPADSTDVQRAPAEATFRLARTREEGFRHDESVVDDYVMVFNESVRGLAPGAPVDFRGITVGEVVSIGVSYDKVRNRINVPVHLRIYPERMRALAHDESREAISNQALRHKAINDLVASGLRGQLRTGSLLTGQLYVAMDFFPKAAHQTVDWTTLPPTLPSTNGDLQALQTTLASVASKLDRIPFEQLSADLHQNLQSLNATLQSADKLVKRVDGELAPELKATLTEARQTFANAEHTLAQQSPMQQELQNTLREVARAAQSVRELTDYLERHPESLVRGKTEEEPTK